MAVKRGTTVADIRAKSLLMQITLHQRSDLGVVLDDEDVGGVAHRPDVKTASIQTQGLQRACYKT